MMTILGAVHLYQRKVGKCVAIANEVIGTYEHVRFMLDICNAQVDDILAKPTFVAPTLVQTCHAHENLASLQRRVFELNGTVAIAQLNAIAQLDEVFYEMRSALDACDQLLHGDMDCVRPIMIRCHRDIDEVCHRLVDSCIVDAQGLRAMGIEDL